VFEFFLAFEGPFWARDFGDFAMKSSAGGHGSYASCYFICADIKSK
jgi:hypothetical protein